MKNKIVDGEQLLKKVIFHKLKKISLKGALKVLKDIRDNEARI